MAANNKFFSLRLFTLLVFFIFSSSRASSFPGDSLVNKKRLRTIVIGSSTAYAVTLAGLNHLWYKNSRRQSFQFFNDIPEWKQVDKLGHFYSSFYLSYGMSRALRWSNLPAKKSDLTGALTGFLVLLPVEIFDGYSDAYGASYGDLIANAAGASFFLSQKVFWKEVRIVPKFSFHYTGYAAERPNVLGDNNVSQILKDYNGQTYWLSFDMDKFMTFPKWLNLAAGYGANDMVFARDSQNKAIGYDPYRQYYVSIDFDLTAIRTRSKILKTLIFIANTIKIPAPSLEFSRKKLVFHPLHF